MEELEDLYRIYNTIVLEFLKNPRQYDEYGKRVSIDTEMYKAMISYYGYDKKPNIVDDREYNQNENSEIFHGFTDIDHGRELLDGDKYNLGTGGYTPGLFFTKRKEVASWYTNHEVENLEEDQNRILGVKLGSTNGLKFSSVQDLIVSPKNDLPPETRPEHKQKIEKLYDFCENKKNSGMSSEGFLKTMKKLSNFSVYLGLDYVEEEKYEHVIVFNRHKAIVAKESDLERFGGKFSESERV